MARRRCSRSRTLDEDTADVRRSRRLRPGRSRRPQLPLRRARVRLGGDRERPRALEAAAVLVGLPHLLGLRARRDPALRAHGDPGDPHLHARLDRRRRGRSDAPAGRAARVAPRDARAARVQAGRRERGRRDLAVRRAAAARAGGARALAAGAADRRPLGLRRPPEWRRAHTCSSTPTASRTSFSSRPAPRSAWRWRPATSSPGRASARASSRCRARSSSTASRRSTATPCSRRP